MAGDVSGVFPDEASGKHRSIRLEPEGKARPPGRLTPNCPSRPHLLSNRIIHFAASSASGERISGLSVSSWADEIRLSAGIIQ